MSDNRELTQEEKSNRELNVWEWDTSMEELDRISYKHLEWKLIHFYSFKLHLLSSSDVNFLLVS